MDSQFPELVFKKDEDFDEKRLNRAMEILDARLRALECFQPSWQEAIDVLQKNGLDRLNTAILPIYQQLTQVAQIGILFTANSSSLVNISLGLKSFILEEKDRARFAAAAYICVQQKDDPTFGMSGSLATYDRTTGTLQLNVTTTSGTGSFSNWVLSASATPNLAHELRKDNPHQVTASQIGTYTSAQVDTKIKSAIDDLKAGAPETYDTLREISDYIATDQSQASAILMTLGTKANVTDVTSALALKADAATVNTAIAAKVATPIRQSVLTGPLDAAGLPACLSIGAGLNVIVKAGTICSFAGGYGSAGCIDYIGRVTSDVSVPVDSTKTSYIYADYNIATGMMTFGTGQTPYQINKDGKGLSSGDVFSISSMRMFTYPTGNPVLRVYLGECVPGTGVVSNILSYAYGGMFVSDPMRLPRIQSPNASSWWSSVTIVHNLGCPIAYQKASCKLWDDTFGMSDPILFRDVDLGGDASIGSVGFSYIDQNRADYTTFSAYKNAKSREKSMLTPNAFFTFQRSF